MAFALANLLLGALVALVVGQNARAICLPLGLMDFPDADGGRKLHAKDTPLAGGIALVLTVLATVVLQLPVAGDPQTGRMLLWFLIAVVGLFLVGLLDDRVGLSARIRLAAAAIILLAAAVALDTGAGCLAQLRSGCVSGNGLCLAAGHAGWILRAAVDCYGPPEGCRLIGCCPIGCRKGA